MEEQKKGKITNPNYVKFLKQGVIDLLNEEEVNLVLDNISLTARYPNEARALFILLYYTGCRPAESMYMCGKHFKQEGTHLVIKFELSHMVKRTLPRSIRLLLKKPLVKELYNFAMGFPPEMYLFHHYRSLRTKTVKNKYGVKQYNDIASKLYNHMIRWTKNLNRGSIDPYFLRHNCFSKMIDAGASDADLQFTKGARTPKSIEPYKHLSTRRSKNLASIMSR